MCWPQTSAYRKVAMELTADKERMEAEVLVEFAQTDPVIRNVGYVNFLSRSKGRGRKRRKWLEVELFRYQLGWHLSHKFAFDEIADELIDEVMDADEFRHYVQQHCLPDKGCMKPSGIK